MSFKIKRTWDEENGFFMFTVKDRNKTFTGVSTCHPDDEEFKSENFGETIAALRATIDFLRDLRDNEILPQFKIIKHLYTNMTTNKKFNSKSYEATMVRRQLHILEGQVKAIRRSINEHKDQIAFLLDSKEQMNNLIRSKKDNS